MRVLLQRVSEASVTVDDAVVGAIDRGYLALVGISHDDTDSTAEAMASKVAHIRLFPNPDVPEKKPIDAPIDPEHDRVLAVSQFTLYADMSRGRRPSFVPAARPEVAEPIFGHFVASLRAVGVGVETGVFGAHMDVTLVNTGPVTVLLEA